MNRPNILLLTIDSLRADRLGSYGNSRGVARTLEQLAGSGIRFNQAITGGSWTQAAFPVILTSTYASMHGGCLGPLSPERPSPVEALARHGYATAGFSSSPLLSRAYAYDRGFGQFVDLEPHGADPRLRQIKGGQYLLRQPVTHWVAGLMGQSLRPAPTYPSAEEVNRAFFDWLARGKAPFFAWLHYMDVHWPYHLEQDLKGPRSVAEAWRDLARMYSVNWQDGRLTAHDRERYVDLYDRAVRYVDSQLEELLAGIRAVQKDRELIVVVVSDHGEEFLERRHWGHVEINLYDEILRVPLVFYFSGRTLGRTVSRQVRTLDIMPTLLELCNCQAPDGMLGASMVPLLEDNRYPSAARVSISERWRDDSHIVAVRTETFKYIWNDHRADLPELYDLVSDPAERQNVIREYPTVADELHRFVDEHLDRVEASRPEHSASQPDLDATVIARLRDLGYVE